MRVDDVADWEMIDKGRLARRFSFHLTPRRSERRTETCTEVFITQTIVSPFPTTSIQSHSQTVQCFAIFPPQFHENQTSPRCAVGLRGLIQVQTLKIHVASCTSKFSLNSPSLLYEIASEKPQRVVFPWNQVAQPEDLFSLQAVRFFSSFQG